MLRQQLLTNANDFYKKLSTIALSRLDQQEALRTMVTKVSASTVNKTSTSSGGKIPLQSHKKSVFQRFGTLTLCELVGKRVSIITLTMQADVITLVWNGCP